MVGSGRVEVSSRSQVGPRVVLLTVELSSGLDTECIVETADGEHAARSGQPDSVEMGPLVSHRCGGPPPGARVVPFGRPQLAAAVFATRHENVAARKRDGRETAPGGSQVGGGPAGAQVQLIHDGRIAVRASSADHEQRVGIGPH